MEGSEKAPSFLARHPSTRQFWKRHLVADVDSEPGPVSRQATIFRRFFAIFYTHLTQGVHITLPFLLASYMVRHFAEEGKVEAKDEQSIGQLIGFLGAAFCGSQLLTSYPLGRLSDYVGRKPIMVVGNLSSIVAAVLFGLADTYRMAILARAAGGFFNGIIGAEKAILGEALTGEEQGKAFAYFSIAWGLGALLGPLLGGIFSFPCSQGGGMLQGTAVCHEDSLLQRRPFLLPCLVAAALSGLAVFLSLFLLEETLPKLQQQVQSSSKGSRAGRTVKLGAASAGAQGGKTAAGSSSSSMSREAAAGERVSLLAGEGAGRAGEVDAHWEVELGTLPREDPEGSGTQEEPDALVGNTGKGGGRPGDSAGSSPAAGSERLRQVAGSSAAKHGLRRTDTAVEEEEEGEEAALLSRDSTAAAAGGEEPWYRHKPVLLALGGYGAIAFFYNFSDEVLPIFASAPPGEGGLGFTTSQLAPSLSFGGITLMLWALFGFPLLLRRFGTRRVVQIGLWSTPAFALLLPLASLCGGRMLPSQAIMFAGLGIRGITSTNAFTACIIMVNQCAPEGTLGRVNGAGQSVASFVRAAAPALGGLMWGWSTALPLPGHQFLPFVFITVVALGTLLVYRELKPPQAEVKVVPEGALEEA
ncbi:hypothetical protein N2152v2_001789 [Parachlorella kessleri]